ncbi:adhesion G-protein coupled receptor G4-like [Betta splendens]|uniref:Adhesion G-protein coupled receptor G4-like n=1 Tax=Betta splendens TaxID=158456 RepID=A0A9W2Y9C5_BETSP|nr:adhesion G-protein coupled receptor G4-like [Betta splendens]
MDPNLEACALVVETIPDLDDIEVTADNAEDVVEMIKDLLSNHSTLNCHELVTVLKKLQDIVSLSVVTPNLGQALINIISNILESESNLVPFTNTILNITETVGDKMVGYEGSSTLVAPSVAISVLDMVPGQFIKLTFGVSSDGTGANPEIFINRDPFNGTVAFISLPSVLQHNFPQESLSHNPRVQFQFYGIPGLFKSSQKGKMLNTFVVSASVTNASSPVKDLHEHVKVMLRHLTPNTNYRDVECVYWNFDKNDGNGGWDNYGCKKYSSSSDYTTCLCDHLTHFGVLLDVSREELDSANEQILTIITYVGCGVSSLFLGITVLTYTAFEKLRRDYPSQILINLSLALLGLNLVFLVNSWLSSWGVYGLCVTAGSMLHYFLLASFTWMGLEAVNMYLALVKVFNVYVPSYILKFCILGWGFPLVICTLVLIVNREAYGSHFYAQSGSQSLDNSDNFCWLQDNVTFYVSVVAYALLIFLFNTAVFVVVLMQIRHMRANSPAGTRSGLLHDLRGVASITLLLGLTWTVGFFTWGPARVVLLYLFSGLNSLQGLFIFLFHCLMKENVRKQWRIHLCVGRFRLDEFSEWSHSASVGAMAKPKPPPPKASVPSVRSVKSSSTDSTSASSDSSRRETSCRRPNLGLFVNSLPLPRAQRSPAATGAVDSQRCMNPTPGWRNQLLSQQGQR